MADLSKLAADNNLECELYYGGGIHKILDLLGKQRQRKFIKETAKAKINDREKWAKLVKFLESERSEREAYTLHVKVRKCMNLDKGDDKDREKEKNKREKDKLVDFNSRSYSGQVGKHSDISSERCLCHICGKDQDHVLSTDLNNKPYVEYVACNVFVGKSPRERDKLLYRKRFCSKCLTPDVRWNADHPCSKDYVCNQTYVIDRKELKCEKHVLVCGYHS